MPQDTITISKKEYLNLKISDEILARLHAGGVDNWDYYGEAISDGGENSIKEFEEDLKKELGL